MADENSTLSRRRFVMSAGAAGTIAIAGCTESRTPTQTTTDDSGGALKGSVSVTGSSTVFPLATAVQEKFTEKYPDVDISVSATGSGGGFKNHFCPGRSDLNNASRPITKEEKKLCSENGVDWHEIKVATDALTVIVNEQNDWVDSMTFDQLRQIWKPDPAQKWSDVNPEWPDEEIVRFGAAPTSGTFDYFTEAVVGKEGSHTKDYTGTEQDLRIIQGVEGNKYAIGYLGFAYYTENKERVKALALAEGSGDPVKPSLKTAKSGAYPLSRPLFTYLAKDPASKDQVAEFARYFCKQSANEELVAKKVGYVPNSESEMQAELSDLNDFITKAQS